MSQPPSLRVVSDRTAAEALARVRAADEGLLERAADTVDAALRPLDRFKDTLGGELAEAATAVEQKTARVPILGQAVQFLHGAGAAVAAMAEGTYQAIRHPIETIKGLWTMASHVPLISPSWWYRLATEGAGNALGGDRVFWGAVVGGMLAPYKKDWQDGRYFAVAGRAAVEIGTLYMGVKNAKKAFDAWRANRAAVDDVARHAAGRADEGMKAAVLADDGPRVSGQVIKEGEVLIGPKGPESPVHAGTRARLRKAADHFTGDRPAVRKKAVVSLERQRLEYRRLDQVGPKRLATDPVIQKRYRLVTDSVQGEMTERIYELTGIRPSGAAKDPVRAAAKLQKWQGETGPQVRLGDLEDLTRGRIDFPRLDYAKMKAVVQQLEQHFGRDNMIIIDHLKGKPFYRGRLHVKVRHASGMWYELQMGPRQISQFFDSKFLVRGRETNIHDLVYKGLMRLDNEQMALIGQGNLNRGQAIVTRLMKKYADNLDGAMKLAGDGKALLFERHTHALREGLVRIFDQLPEEKLPAVLRTPVIH